MNTRCNDVIVVDDDAQYRGMVVDALQVAGHKAVSVSSAKDCLALCAKNSPLLIVDLMMPDVDGLELIKMLSNARCKCPLIFMSGGDVQNLETAELIARGKGLEVRGCIEKPFLTSELLTLI